MKSTPEAVDPEIPAQYEQLQDLLATLHRRPDLLGVPREELDARWREATEKALQATVQFAGDLAQRVGRWLVGQLGKGLERLGQNALAALFLVALSKPLLWLAQYFPQQLGWVSKVWPDLMKLFNQLL